MKPPGKLAYQGLMEHFRNRSLGDQRALRVGAQRNRSGVSGACANSGENSDGVAHT